MPPMLHDPAVRDSTRARIAKLSATSPRAWGRMTVDQMLWHCNEALEATLGRRSPKPMAVPLPKAFLRFAIINLPWPKGAKTYPDWVAGGRYDLEAERTRLLRLIDEVTAKSLDSSWPESPAAGRMSGKQWSQLQAKHLDHHLKQFGV